MHRGLWNMDRASFFSEATLIEIGVHSIFIIVIIIIIIIIIIIPGFIKSGKRSIFVIHSYLNDNACTEVKRDAKF